MENIIRLLNYNDQVATEDQQLEALMDVSNILTGACLNALSAQLNVTFSHSHPILLGQHSGFESMLNNNASRWGKVMAIEIAYAIKSRDIRFDLLLLFPEQSMAKIYSRLVDEEYVA